MRARRRRGLHKRGQVSNTLGLARHSTWASVDKRVWAHISVDLHNVPAVVVDWLSNNPLCALDMAVADMGCSSWNVEWVAVVVDYRHGVHSNHAVQPFVDFRRSSAH